jgi:phage-related protein
MTVGQLVATFDLNNDPAARGILAAELQMRGLQRSADGSIRDMQGRYVSLGRSLDDVAQHARRTGDSGRDAHRGLSLLGTLSGPLSGLGSALAGAASQAASAVGMFAAGAPAAAGLIATLVNIVPAAAIATTALLSVAQAAAVIKIGTGGIGAAFKAAFAPAASGGGAAAGATHKVADAEMALAAAQRQARQAQQSLNDARKQAARDLQDMNNQLVDGQLAQRQAVLDVSDAHDKLLQDQAAGSGATQQQIAQDELAYEQAQQHLKEQQLATKRLTSDTAAANKAGVAGSQKVKSAQDQVLSSQQALIRSQEALKDAMSGSGGGGGGVNALAAAMAKLAPNARAFVREVIALKPAWRALQLDVQQHLFAGLAGSLKSTAGTLLPTLRRELVSSAGAMNLMGLGVLSAAKGLGTSGVLGSAMHSASAGLHNMAGIPGLIVTAFGQLASAAGPQWERLTKSIGSGAASLGKMLGAAFKSGALTDAINTAVSLIKEIGQVALNVGGVLRSVFKATSASGGGFLGVLKTISGVLNKAFASPAVQSALRALFGVMNALATTAAPLLMQVLGVIAPVLTALGPPTHVLIAALGKALSPIISALGPLLLSAAGAVGALVDGLAPLLPVVGEIIAAVGPMLTPAIDGLALVFRQTAPLVTALAGSLMGLLKPILASLPSIIKPLVGVLTTLTGTLLPVLTQLVVAQAPALAQLGTSFGQVMVALGPLIGQLGVLLSDCLQVIMPILPPIIKLVGQLALIMSGQLAKQITLIVIPALKLLTDVLSGRFKTAGQDAKTLVKGILTVIRGLPGLAMAALKDVGSALVGAGKGLIQGFLDGIVSKVTNVKTTLQDLTQSLTSWKGPASLDARILTPNGRLLIGGLMDGINKEIPALRSQLGGITSDLPGMAGSLGTARGSLNRSAPAGGGSTRPFTVNVHVGDHQIAELMVDPIRKIVKTRGGGSVQATFGT